MRRSMSSRRTVWSADADRGCRPVQAADALTGAAAVVAGTGNSSCRSGQYLLRLAELLVEAGQRERAGGAGLQG